MHSVIRGGKLTLLDIEASQRKKKVRSDMVFKSFIFAAMVLLVLILYVKIAVNT